MRKENKSLQSDLLEPIPKNENIRFAGVLHDASTDILEMNNNNYSMSKNNSFFVKSPDQNIETTDGNTETSTNLLQSLYRSVTHKLTLDDHHKSGKKDNDDAKDHFQCVNFIEIVQNLDETKLLSEVVDQEYIGKFVFSEIFTYFVTFIIILNTVIICIETNEKYKRVVPILFQTVDAVCVIIFTVEIILKLTYDFREFWFSGWNWFDLIIVTLSLFASSVSFLSSARIIRIMRIFRSFRIFKAIDAFKPLHQLFNAFLISLLDVLNVLILIFLFLIVCTFLALSLFNTVSPDWFGSFTKTLWTLVILLTQDGWLDPYNELVEGGQIYFAMVFFLFFIFIGSMILINILVGVSCNSLAIAKEQEKNATESQEMVIKMEQKKNRRKKRTQRHFQQPPLLGDRSWKTQTPFEIPDVNHIDPDQLMKLYIVTQLMKNNAMELMELNKKHEELVVSVMKRSFSNSPSSQNYA